MLKNFINKYDILILYEALKQGKLNIVLSKLLSSNGKKIKKSWNYVKKQPNNWYDIPKVEERWNKLISGDKKIDYYKFISNKYFFNKEKLNALSLGCGTGHRELNWAKSGVFEKIDAYDISENRIEFAKKKSKELNQDKVINYQIGNVYDIKEANCHYDVIFVEHSLHHFTPLREILLKINNLLKLDGLFIINEFVGPTRFQWSNRQIEVINGLLMILPKKYKQRLGTSIKKKVFRPSKLSMILSDPSEAVESSDIFSLLNEIFVIEDVKKYGGTILMMLFSEIGHNFLSNDKETRDLLNLCFNTEDILLKNKDIESDFIVAVCKKSRI